MKKNLPFIILLAISLCLNIALTVRAYPNEKAPSMEGTYTLGEAPSQNEICLACDRDGAFTLYRQGEILSEGKYEAVTKTAFYLKNAEDLQIGNAVFTPDDKLCLMADCLDYMAVMTKMDDIPMYINISKSK